MNERIDKLVVEAALTIDTTRGNTYVSHPEFNKKFAELIVKECMAKAKQGKLTNMNGDQIAWVIKEHFGV